MSTYFIIKIESLVMRRKMEIKFKTNDDMWRRKQKEPRKKNPKYWVHTMLHLEDNRRPECVMLKGKKKKNNGHT